MTTIDEFAALLFERLQRSNPAPAAFGAGLELDSLEVLLTLALLDELGCTIEMTSDVLQRLTSIEQIFSMVRAESHDSDSSSSPTIAASASPFRGRLVSLKPLDADSAELLVKLASEPDSIMNWRYRGHVPPPSELLHNLMETSFVHFAVWGNSSNQPIGWVNAYDYRGLTVSVSALGRGGAPDGGCMAEAVLMLASFLTTNWPIEQVEIETWDVNFAQFSSLGRVVAPPCARLREHGFFAGEWHDLLMFSFSASDLAAVERNCNLERRS